MRILVCGGRDYTDRATVYGVLDALKKEHGYITIIHGAAKGADSLAEDWCCENAATFMRYPAEWIKYGNAAGPIRNQQMLDDGKPEYFVAFPGGNGTKDMVRRLRLAKIDGVNFNEE